MSAIRHLRSLISAFCHAKARWADLKGIVAQAIARIAARGILPAWTTTDSRIAGCSVREIAKAQRKTVFEVSDAGLTQ